MKAAQKDARTSESVTLRECEDGVVVSYGAKFDEEREGLSPRTIRLSCIDGRYAMPAECRHLPAVYLRSVNRLVSRRQLIRPLRILQQVGLVDGRVAVFRLDNCTFVPDRPNAFFKLLNNLGNQPSQVFVALPSFFVALELCFTRSLSSMNAIASPLGNSR